MTLALDDVHVALDGRPVLRGVGAELASGALVGVLGPNGAGKSTLARAILGLAPLTGGAVRLDGEDLRRLPAAARARRISYLPQASAVHWPLSVERLVGLGRLPHLAPLSRLAAGDAAAVERALAATDLLHLREREATSLSGGELARALLARCLATEAEVLIADEPLSGLDPAHQLAAMELLAARAAAGALVVVILHDLSLAGAWCDRLLLLSDGRLQADGPPAEVLTDARLAQVYAIAVARTPGVRGPAIVPIRRLADPAPDAA